VATLEKRPGFNRRRRLRNFVINVKAFVARTEKLDNVVTTTGAIRANEGVELRDVQSKYAAANSRLLAAQYQAKLSETELLKIAGLLVQTQLKALPSF
jgi:hypothetical protein